MAEVDTNCPHTGPLLLPAILQNPANHALKQVEAYNAQQREKVVARREARYEPLANSGRGKRVIRRRDNATFAGNPHITLPKRSDFTPPVPLHPRPLHPTFPPSALPRSASIPAAVLPERDPFSSDSRSGAFNTSLKGVRGALRTRGRRAETLVGLVEEEIKCWLGGARWNLDGEAAEEEGWRIVDPFMVDTEHTAGPSTSPTMSRRLLDQHQSRSAPPPLPFQSGQIPAILESSRSPAHLSWAVAEAFERLVIHLVARYYELLSWSEDRVTESGERVRLTHIIAPSLVKPISLPPSHSLLTPDNSDLSAPSSSDQDPVDSSTSDTETEVGYSLETDSHHEGDIPVSAIDRPLTPAMADLHIDPGVPVGADLTRSVSQGSSVYASSEGGSDWSMGDSLTLPPPPGGSAGGWTRVQDSGSEVGDGRPILSAAPAPIRPGARDLGGVKEKLILLFRRHIER